MYMASFNSTIDRYRELLSEQNAGSLKLPNDNLDVGAFTAAGKYRLTDAAYSELLHKLQGHYTEMPQELRSDILAFYQRPWRSLFDQNRRQRLGQGAQRTRSIAICRRGPATSRGCRGQ